MITIKEKEDLVEDKMKKMLFNKKKISSFITRLISGLVLLIFLFLILIKGGDLLFIISAILSLVGIVELFRVFNMAKSRLAYVGYIFTILYYWMLHFYKTTGILLFLIAMLLLLLIFYVISFPKFNIKQVSLVLFAIIYVSIMFSFIYLIREKNEFGKYYVWLIFISSWGSDTFAYCTGILFGKHKLSPILSPKKTIEGAIGGIIGAAILSAIYTFIIFNKVLQNDSYSYIKIVVATSISAIISMLGDLTASAIKRDYGVKDYGDLIPGHGGILDRFDSVIFAAPALFFLLSI